MKYVLKWLRNYFGFSKVETNGFVILLILTLIIIFTPWFLRTALESNKENSLLNIAAYDSIARDIEENITYLKDQKKNKPWNRPGGYTAKKPPGVDYNYDRHIAKKSKRKKEQKETAVFRPFELNSVDSVELKSLRGIGKVLSQRIVKYRELLGGFYSKGQLKEIYGLKPEVLTMLDTSVYINAGTIKTINVNKTNDYELSRHPYIKKSIARSITSYRYQHGDFNSYEELYAIKLLDSATINKIKPYLEF